jgi:hypothetical protein
VVDCWGWAIDLFIGRQTRSHFDIDVAIPRRDQAAAHHCLETWDFHYPVRDKNDEMMLFPWQRGMTLNFEVPGVWAHETSTAPWRFEFLFHEINELNWTFRYCNIIQHSLLQIGGCTSDGIYYLFPEIALLTKAARMRDMDELDFHQILPYLSKAQRDQLAKDIAGCWEDHKWLAMLIDSNS